MSDEDIKEIQNKSLCVIKVNAYTLNTLFEL